MSLYAPKKTDRLTIAILKIRKKEALKETRQVLRNIFLIATPLYILFWVCDIFYSYPDRWTFLMYRAFVIPFALYSYYASKNAKTLLQAQFPTMCYAFMAGLMITIMGLQTQGVTTPYYAGLNLVCIIAVSFIPWTSRLHITIMATLVYAPMIIPYFFYSQFKELNILIVNSFFMVTTIIFSIAVRYFQDKLHYKRVYASLLLQEEIENRDKLIAEKTKELNESNQQLIVVVKETSAGISHDIGQPLSAVMGHLAILARLESKNLIIQNKLKLIDQYMKQVNKQVHHLQNITRYETKKYANNQTIIDLSKSTGTGTGTGTGTAH